MNHTPIVIATFRASFRDLQPGDQVLDHRGSFHAVYEALTVTKVTPTQFVCGSRRFNRDNGNEIGALSRFHTATLPDPERLARINADAEEKAVRRALRDADLSNLPLDTAKQVLALIEASQS